MIKVSKGRFPKALDDFTNLSVLCQVVRFTYAFCYQFLMSFRCFGIFPLDRTGFFTFIIPGSRDIVQVVQTVQIDLQKFRITAPRLKYGICPQKHRAQLLQRAKRPCNRNLYNNTVNYFVTFLLG